MINVHIYLPNPFLPQEVYIIIPNYRGEKRFPHISCMSVIEGNYERWGLETLPFLSFSFFSVEQKDVLCEECS